MRVRPSPRPSRSASEVARSRLSTVSHTRPNHSPVLTALFLVSAVSHTRPNYSAVSLQRPVVRGPRTVPRSRSFGCLFLVLDRHDYRVTACVHRRNTGRTRPSFVARLARSDSPQSRGPCPRADPPSPRPSRSASDVARSRLRGVPHAPYVVARTPAPIYCYLLLLLGLLPYLRLSNRLIILYVLAPIRPYVPAVLYTMVGCACRVKLRMTKGVVSFFPYRTAIRSGLTCIILGAIRTCSTRPFTMHGWLCLPCGIADDKASCLLLF